MNKQRLEELLLAWEEDRLTTEESAELKQLLTAHPEARQRLVETGVLESVAGARSGTTKRTRPSTMPSATQSAM